MKNRNPPAPRIALALAGGGPLGAIYEIGALCALEEALQGLDFTALDHYVGVSAGSFIAAGLANGMSPRALCAAFIDDAAGSKDNFDPSWLMRPAYDEFARRAIMLPGLAASALWRATVGRRSIASSLERLGAALPVGIFSNEQIHRRLGDLFSRGGRTNDFRELKAKLTVVATDLDSGDAAPFGRPGWDHVPISRAVQASSAMPGLFPPVEIEDRYFVDGALKKTMHASVALDEGVDLLLCLNPLVPFNAATHGSAIPRIVDGGLPAVLGQTFRSLIHSRMALGMKHYERAYPGTDIVLIEPDHRDPELYLANTFAYGQRRRLAEHAYQRTRAMLRERHDELSPKLKRHGIELRMDVLEDARRHLVAPSLATTRIGRATAKLHAVLDDLSVATRLAPR
ncbi:MAG: patatin-like phospholipase family protein [Pseudomonadota bacterium]